MQVEPRPKAKSTVNFSNSEDLMRMVGKSVGITNEKTLDRFLLKGRNCRNTKEFVGKRNADCLRKKEMLLKGKVILGEVYRQKEGMQFFKNDWFMGPFYSYDHNEKELAQWHYSYLPMIYWFKNQAIFNLVLRCSFTSTNSSTVAHFCPCWRCLRRCWYSSR